MKLEGKSYQTNKARVAATRKQRLWISIIQKGSGSDRVSHGYVGLMCEQDIGMFRALFNSMYIYIYTHIFVIFCSNFSCCQSWQHSTFGNIWQLQKHGGFEAKREELPHDRYTKCSSSCGDPDVTSTPWNICQHLPICFFGLVS